MPLLQSEHWARPLRNAPAQSLEGRIWIAACILGKREESEVRAIAQIAFDQNVAVHHAEWIYKGQQGRCPCATCDRLRRHGIEASA